MVTNGDLTLVQVGGGIVDRWDGDLPRDKRWVVDSKVDLTLITPGAAVFLCYANQLTLTLHRVVFTTGDLTLGQVGGLVDKMGS